MHARVQATHDRLLGSDLHASGTRRLLSTVLALLVHLVTLVLVAVAGWLWTTSAFTLAKVIGTGLLLVVAWEVRPRFGTPPADDALLTRNNAPHSFAVLDRVAAAVGAHAPHFLVVSAHYNASMHRVGLRGHRVLTVGLPMWEALDDRQRLAALAHECAHDVNGDVRSTLLVGTAIESLHSWAWLLRPDMRVTRQRWSGGSRRRRGGGPGFFAIAEYLVPVVLLPLSATVGLLAVGLHRLAARSGQRAEYRADAIAAQVAGTDAAAGTLDALFGADPCMQAMLQAARADRDADVWAAQQRYLQSVTPAQRERWRRLAARARHRTDSSHPPTLLRLEMLRSRPVRSGSLDISPAAIDAMTTELRAFRPSVARQIRELAAS